jgi:hypothetical protein
VLLHAIFHELLKVAIAVIKQSDKDLEGDEDDKDPRPAKRQKLRSGPAHKDVKPRPQNPISAAFGYANLKFILRCGNKSESREGCSSPSFTGDEEPTPSASTAYPAGMAYTRIL